MMLGLLILPLMLCVSHVVQEPPWTVVARLPASVVSPTWGDSVKRCAVSIDGRRLAVSGKIRVVDVDRKALVGECALIYARDRATDQSRWVSDPQLPLLRRESSKFEEQYLGGVDVLAFGQGNELFVAARSGDTRLPSGKRVPNEFLRIDPLSSSTHSARVLGELSRRFDPMALLDQKSDGTATFLVRTASPGKPASYVLDTVSFDGQGKRLGRSKNASPQLRFLHGAPIRGDQWVAAASPALGRALLRRYVLTPQRSLALSEVSAGAEPLSLVLPKGWLAESAGYLGEDVAVSAFRPNPSVQKLTPPDRSLFFWRRKTGAWLNLGGYRLLGGSPNGKFLCLLSPESNEVLIVSTLNP